MEVLLELNRPRNKSDPSPRVTSTLSKLSKTVTDNSIYYSGVFKVALRDKKLFWVREFPKTDSAKPTNSKFVLFVWVKLLNLQFFGQFRV